MVRGGRFHRGTVAHPTAYLNLKEDETVKKEDKTSKDSSDVKKTKRGGVFTKIPRVWKGKLSLSKMVVGCGLLGSTVADQMWKLVGGTGKRWTLMGAISDWGIDGNVSTIATAPLSWRERPCTKKRSKKNVRLT